MATEPRTTGLTYADLERFPEDHVRREIIDGELLVSPSPGGRHQDAVTELLGRLWLFVKEHGGKVYPARRDVFFSDSTVLEPDIVFVSAANVDKAEERFVRGAPDLVIEVSSPSTRRTDQTRKRAVYERERVPEHWFVDLDSERIEIYRLEGGRYVEPELRGRGELVTSPVLPGVTIPVDDVLGPS